MKRKDLIKLRDEKLLKRFNEEYKTLQYGSNTSKTDMVLDKLQYEFFLEPSYMYIIIFQPHKLRRNNPKYKLKYNNTGTYQPTTDRNTPPPVESSAGDKKKQ